MKKFMKSCAIAALVMCVAGALLAAVATTVAGKSLIESTVESVSGGRVHLNFDGVRDWGVTFGETMDDAFSVVNYEIGDKSRFADSHEVMTGTVEKFSLGSDVTKLDVEVGGCVFNIKTSDDDNFYLEAEKADKLQAYAENGTLIITSTATAGSSTASNHCRINLYVPADYYFAEAEIGLGAGTMDIPSLKAGEASLEVGAGQITAGRVEASNLGLSVGMGQMTVEELYANELDTEVGMGQMTVEELYAKELDAEVGMGGLKFERCDISKEADIECDMGSLEMELVGSQEEFNYEVEGTMMGNVKIGGDSYSGVSIEKSINNRAAKTIDISGSVGNITLTFTE